jgi:hypothetical protein
VASAIAIFLSLITITLLLIFLIRFKKIFSTDNIIEKTRLYMDRMIKDINNQSNRDLELVKESSNRLKALLNESEHKMELFREATNRLRDMIAEAERLNQIAGTAYVENKNLSGIKPIRKPSSSRRSYERITDIDPDAAYEINKPQQRSLFDSDEEEQAHLAAQKSILNDETTVTQDGAAYKKVPLIITDVYDEGPKLHSKSDNYKPPKPVYTEPVDFSKSNFSNRVWNLFNSGYQVEQIATELSCSVTEVQLIIDMGL